MMYYSIYLALLRLQKPRKPSRGLFRVNPPDHVATIFFVLIWWMGLTMIVTMLLLREGMAKEVGVLIGSIPALIEIHRVSKMFDGRDDAIRKLPRSAPELRALPRAIALAVAVNTVYGVVLWALMRR